MKTAKNAALEDSQVHCLYNRPATARVRPVGINWNVTGRKRRAQGPRPVSEYDLAAGLASAARFEREVTASFFQSQATSGTTAVMAIDLDQTKYLEGSLANTERDELLKHLATRLSRSLRRGDSIGRLPDGRFVVGLANLASGDDARIVAQKIVWNFSEPIHVSGAEIYISVRIGIALPAERFDPVAMIKHATIAMREVEARGGGAGYEFHRPARGQAAVVRSPTTTGAPARPVGGR